MSGRTKRTIYIVFTVSMVVLAYAGAILLAAFFARKELDYGLFSLALVLELLSVPALFHELGHLLVGLCVGLRPATFSFGWFTVGRGGVKFGKSVVAGETQLYATNGKRPRFRLICSTLGGPLMNLLLGGGMLAFFFALPFSSGVLFLGAFAPFMLSEGLRALYPAQLEEGKTDGAVLLGLIKKAPEEEVMLIVLEAEGILRRGSFSDLPEGLLENAPVVREDLPAVHGLWLLRAQKALFLGEEEAAKGILERLLSENSCLTLEETAEVERYLAYFAGEFRADERALLDGVKELDRKLLRET